MCNAPGGYCATAGTQPPRTAIVNEDPGAGPLPDRTLYIFKVNALEVSNENPAPDAAPPTCDVVVVGSLNMDLVTRTPRLPQPGETLTGSGFSITQGGKGANQAVALARLGASVAMIGCVGDDDYGRALLANLGREGIDHRGVRIEHGCPTGIAAITVDDTSQNSIIVVPGSNHALTQADIEPLDRLLRDARLLICQLEVPLDTVRFALQAARRHGCTTLLNAAPILPLDDALLALVDWLVVNEIEAAALAGQAIDTPDDARSAVAHLRRRGCRNLLITLGAQGTVAAFGDELRHFKAQKVAAIDTTGAGDTFVGGFGVAIAQGLAPEAAIRLGQAAAAIAVTRAGAQTAMPYRDEIASQPSSHRET
jgi:ribokinase